MVLSLLIFELWLLVETQALGKFKERFELAFNIKLFQRRNHRGMGAW